MMTTAQTQEIKIGTQLLYTNGCTYEHVGEVMAIDGDRFLITEVKGHRHHLSTRMYIYSSQIKKFI